MSAPSKPAIAATPEIDVDFPELDRWAAGNAGIPYVWTFPAKAAGPHVVLQALTHGNEVCGAIALDWLLREGFRPLRGTMTVVFANIAAYRAFDHADPFASRCVDEDFNRLWTPDVLDGPRDSVDLGRARTLRPVYDRADYLLDLHSMTDPCPPLALAGPPARRDWNSRSRWPIRSTSSSTTATRPAAACATTRSSTMPDDPRNSLLIECGQHWERAAPGIARQSTLRLLRHFGMADHGFLDAHLDPAPRPPQQVIEVTDGGDHPIGAVRVRAAGAGARRHPDRGDAAGTRRRRGSPDALRRLRADHAHAAPEARRDRGAAGPPPVLTAFLPRRRR